MARNGRDGLGSYVFDLDMHELIEHSTVQNAIFSGGNLPLIFFFGSAADQLGPTAAASAAAKFPACGKTSAFLALTHMRPHIMHSRVRANAI